MNLGNFLKYSVDAVYAATRYPSGWQNPAVVEGRFASDEIGHVQQRLFDVLLQHGFQRTRWQLVFPGQIAGVIRPIAEVLPNAENEHHVRFYRIEERGLIHCEAEMHRFGGDHWRGPRRHANEVLEVILEHEVQSRRLTDDIQNKIRAQFGETDFALKCVRPSAT